MRDAARAVVATLTFVLISPATEAKDDKGEWCEQEWRVASAKASEQDPPDNSGLLKHWQKIGQQCAGTGAYEARLAIAYLLLNQSDKARDVLRPLVGQRSAYVHLVDFALLYADATDVMSGPIT